VTVRGERLPGTGDDDPRVILHVDMDCFYASCERLRDPSLAGEPVVVGMGYEDGDDGGAVATASYEAREHGVESAQPISRALDLLPRRDAASGEGSETSVDASGDGADTPPTTGRYLPVDMDFYESVAADVKAILRDCADRVREVSVDEAYLDATGRTSWERAADGDRTLAAGYARHVKARIEREVGVPASVGVAPTMGAAKVASDHDKPDGLVVVEPGDVRAFLAPLPAEALHGVGPVTAAELGEMGIETAGDLAAADPAALRDHFGERGRTMYDRARGADDREVTPTGRPKSLSRESAFGSATDDPAQMRETVRALATDVAERARREGAMYRTIGLKAVTPPFDVHTRARSLPGPVDDPPLVADVACDLLGEFADGPVRKLGVRVSNLSFADAEQARLDGWTEGTAEAAPETDSPAPRRRERGQTSLAEFSPEDG
jgi:DNA polymerase IV (DinB-like DNA polymerase)